MACIDLKCLRCDLSLLTGVVGSARVARLWEFSLQVRGDMGVGSLPDRHATTNVSVIGQLHDQVLGKGPHV
jgi:hypothetical protein